MNILAFLSTDEIAAWVAIGVTVIGVVATYVRALAKINDVEKRVQNIMEMHAHCREIQDKRSDDIKDSLSDIRERLAKLEALMTSVLARLDNMAANHITTGKRGGARDGT